MKRTIKFEPLYRRLFAWSWRPIHASWRVWRIWPFTFRIFDDPPYWEEIRPEFRHLHAKRLHMP